MSTAYRVTFKTYEAYALSQVRFGKHNKRLLDKALAKIARLKGLAKQGYVYAFVKLLDCRQMCINLADELNEQNLTHQKDLSDLKSTQFQVMASNEHYYDIKANNPTMFKLMQVITCFDDLVFVLKQLKDCGNIEGQRAYFSILGKNKKKVFRLLSDIVKIPLQQVHRVTFDDFLNQSENYLLVAKELGVIKPGVLFNAINLTDMPNLSTQDLNKISSKLREMA